MPPDDDDLNPLLWGETLWRAGIALFITLLWLWFRSCSTG